MPGVLPEVVDLEGKPVAPNSEGFLIIKRPWPSMARTLWHDPDRSETSVGPERLTRRQLSLDGPTSLDQLMRDRPLDALVRQRGGVYGSDQGDGKSKCAVHAWKRVEIAEE